MAVATKYLRFNGKLLKFNDSLLTVTTGGGGTYPTDSLWAIWRLNDTLNDTSGNGNNLTAASPVYTSGSILSYTNSWEGTDNINNVPYIQDNIFLSNHTVAAWVKPLATVTWGGSILSIEQATPGCGDFDWRLIGNNTSMEAYPSKICQGDASSVTSNWGTLTQWHHVAIVWDATAWKQTLFHNGVQVGDSGANSGNLNKNTLFLGGTGSQYRLDDLKMASVFVYTKKLSLSEVQQLYNLGIGV